MTHWSFSCLKKTLLELNQFLSISQRSLYNQTTPLITIPLDVKNAKANAFATVGLYGFLSPSLDYSESRETIVRNAINTENY